MSESANRETVAFIGLGAMGSPMAGRIAEAGFPVVVTDLDLEKAEAFSRSWGCRSAPSACLAARDATVVVTMLPNSQVVEQVLFGEDSVCDGPRAGTVVIEMSSGIPRETRRFAAGLRERGATMVDAPVSGGVARARTGDLAIMVGGESSDVDRALPVLEVLGSSIHRTGPVGTGQAMKALNNLVSAACLAVTCEALEVGRAFGLDQARMVDVLNASSGMNNATLRKFKQFILSESFDSGFSLDLLVKDLGIALGLADQVNLDAPISELSRQIWARAQGELGTGRDHTEIAKAIARWASD